MATTVAFSELNTWLQSQPANTVDTPYELEVTGLLVGDVQSSEYTGTLGYVLKQNNTKYVDLRETVLPTGNTSLEKMFYECSSLVYAPSLPNDVDDITRTFSGCTNLKSSPVIPSNVIVMYFTFEACSALETAPVIPESVTDIRGLFYDCTSLINPPTLPSRVTDLYALFYHCTLLTAAPTISNGVTSLNQTFSGCTSLINAPVIPNSVTNMNDTFSGCSLLTTAPVIPNSVTSMSETFYGCSALTTTPIIPDSVVTFSSAFRNCTSLTTATFSTNPPILFMSFAGCTSLTTVNVQSFDSSKITSYTKIFMSCTNLTEFYCDTPYELKTWLDTIKTASSDNFPNDVSNCHFYLYSEPAEISITSFNNDLSALTANTVSTPFQIKVTGLTPQDVESSAQGGSAGTLGSFLIANPTKYVDLSLTVMPNVTDLTSTFENCTTLIESPDLPSAITVLDSTYKGCSNLTEIKSVPSTVTYLTDCFKNCSSLESIDEFDVPLSVLKTNAEDCFSGCTSLTSIGVQGVAPITEASEWHVIRLNFGANDVSGKVYDKDKNTTTIPQTTVQKGTLKLPVKTDELWFPPSNMSDADVDEVIESVIDTKRTYFNKDVLNPLNKSFVLWKDSQSQFVSNIDFGGSGGSGITVYPTQEELEEDLPNLQDGDIVGTYGDDNTNYNDAPLGSVMSYLGNTDPSDGKWLICDGRDTTGTAIELETHYPNLYMFLGGTNVLPEIFDHSRPSAIETLAITTTNQTAQYDGVIIFNGATNAGIVLYINNVAVSYTAYASGSGQPRNTATIPIRKGDSYRADNSSYTSCYAQWYKSHKIIKAVSSVDYYHAPSSEITQIEQYFDNGLQNAESYSTTETLTGGKWIDGKPIYRKVITDLSISTSNSYVTLMSKGDIDTIIRTFGMTTNNKTNFALDSFVNGSNIQIRTTYSTQLINTVVIEYTKTTD